jgi:hypothetical protein
VSSIAVVQYVGRLIIPPDRTSRGRRDQPLLPTHNDYHRPNTFSRRCFIYFMEEANRPDVWTGGIPLNSYGPGRLSDVVD